MSSNIGQIVGALAAIKPGDQVEFSTEGGGYGEGVFAWRFRDGKVTIGSNIDDDPTIQAILQGARLANNGERGMYVAPDGVPFSDQDAAAVIDQILTATFGQDYSLTYS